MFDNTLDNFSSLEISREDRYPESFDINFFVSKEKEHYCRKKRKWKNNLGKITYGVIR